MIRPLFSLIIPCYNSHKTIQRLFDSLMRQGISYNDLEVIVVDDNSSCKKYLDIIHEFDSHLNIQYFETNVKVHCPGNTRREGMKHVSGQWLCFCDHDDYFEDNALQYVKQYITTLTRPRYVISTIMNAYDEINHVYQEKFAHKQAWLHGKFYNVDNLINPYQVNFKVDLVTHEDIYFNAAVLAELLSLGEDWDYLDINTYRWVDEPTSITRSAKCDRGYLYEHFDDYIESASYAFAKKALQNNNPACFHQVMMTLLHCYFYYEAASSLFGSSKCDDIFLCIIRFMFHIKLEFHFSADDMVNYIYKDAALYNAVKADCMIHCGDFIPKTSFRDFIYYIDKLEGSPRC